MNYEWFIARRYLTAKRKQAFVSVITIVSALGICIGVMALVIAIALITGFQSDVQDKILSSTSHIMVSDLVGDGIEDYPDLITRIEKVKGVETVSPVVFSQILLKGSYRMHGAMLKGVDFEREVRTSSWLRQLERGNIPEKGTKRPGILLGKRLAQEVGAGLGDVVTAFTSTTRLSPMGPMARMKNFVVSGIFKTGLHEFDSTTALISLETAQAVLKLEDRISYFQVRIDNIFQASRIGDRIKDSLPPTIYITTWMELNKSLFSALKLEKTIMFLTISLIVFVAALNIIASLILMVMEKTRDIGILIALGATSRNIQRIFFLQGAMIGVIGTISGVTLGLIWCWLANTFQLIKVPVEIYQIAFVPFYIKILDLLLIIGVTLLISFVSTLFPSRRASKVDPVTALKYE